MELIKLEDNKVDLANLIKSNYLPEHIKSEEQALTLLQFGKELGISPMQSLNGLIMIKGKITLPVRLINALLRQNNVYVSTLEDCLYVYQDGSKSYLSLRDKEGKQIQHVDRITTLEFVRYYKNGHTQKEIVSYTWSDAKKALLTEKENYVKMPREMIYSRCFSKGATRIAPDITCGLLSTDEMVDFSKIKEEKIKRNEDGFIESIDFEEISV